MTNNEAIKEIQKWLDGCPFEDTKEAFNLAIKALEEYSRPQGNWITVHYAREDMNCPEKSMLDFVKCPFCETIHQGRHNYCSRCGADMKGESK